MNYLFLANVQIIGEKHYDFTKDILQSNLQLHRFKALIVINPFSGKKKAMGLWAEYAQPIFDEAEIPYELAKTSKFIYFLKMIRFNNFKLNKL